MVLPRASSSTMICVSTWRVMSSPVFASTTSNSRPSRTICARRSSVMYVELSVSYKRRLAYFLIVTLPVDLAMNRSETSSNDLQPEHSALQHERAPRPLPLFLELVRRVSEQEPELAREALAGLRAYESAERRSRPAPKPEVARVRGACLRDHGGEGPAAILIPSLINPPRILDLDAQVSLADAVARMGCRALLLDWGKADERKELDVAGHVEQLLLPL